jgi:hypothetical protein
MRNGGLAPMGGSGKVVEIDETIIGRVQGAPKKIKQGYHTSWRNVVLTLVERGGGAVQTATVHLAFLPTTTFGASRRWG